MKPRFSLLAAAVLSLAFCAPASATTPLFTETFASNDVAWSYATGGTPPTDNAGWSWSGSYYKAKNAVRLGKSNGGVGSATTPSILIPTGWSKASVTVTFQAAAWFGTTSGLTLSKIEKGVTTELDSWSVSQIADTQNNANNNVADLSAFTSDSNGKAYTATFEVRDSFKLVFATTGSGANCRSFLDSVTVTAEEVVSSLTTLDTPTGLASSDIGFFGFSLSWNSVLNATNGYTVTLSPADGNSGVTVSGTTATMTGLTEGETYIVKVVAKGDSIGTDDSEAAELRDVTTLTAPAVFEPDLTVAASSSAFTVSWSAQNDAAFSVLAWTNKPVNVASQDFAGYFANGTIPEEWIFENSRNHYPNDNAPVDFRTDGNWIASPEFGGPVESVSFYIAAAGTVTNSHFFVYGTTGTTNREDWILLSEVTDSETGKLVSEQKTISVSPSAGIKRIVFAYQKDQGNVRIGTFSVTGTGVGKEPVYLTGYGPSPTDVNTTSVTFANPVAGETYYVEVTATGLSGRTESKTISVPIPAPRRGSVIAVK